MSDSKVKLKPANENPWYVLMTLYGEQEGEGFNSGIYYQNRRAWNAWACQDFDDDRIDGLRAFMRQSDVPPIELRGWNGLSAEIREKHKAAWTARNGVDLHYPGLPNPTDTIMLSGLLVDAWFVCQNMIFVSEVMFQGTVFRGRVQLNGTQFLESVNFESANFQKASHFENVAFCFRSSFQSAVFHDEPRFHYVKFASCGMFANAEFHIGCDFSGSIFGEESGASFEYAKFHGEPNFQDTVFFGDARFDHAVFETSAGFRGARFEKWVRFDNSRFAGSVRFEGALFSGESTTSLSQTTFASDVDFSGSIFSGSVRFKAVLFEGFVNFDNVKFGSSGKTPVVSFADCRFEKPTSFREASFYSTYPNFSGSVLHDKTAFTDHPDHWPKGAQKDHAQAKASCAVIRHSLGKQGLPEAEHFFFRREMGFAGQNGGWWQRLPYRAFDLFSGYGYSIDKPALWLLTLWAVVGTVIHALLQWHVTWTPHDYHPFQAYALSFSNLFSFLGFQKAYLPADFLEWIPASVRVLSALETIAGVALLFFLGLGLRTRFRLR